MCGFRAVILCFPRLLWLSLVGKKHNCTAFFIFGGAYRKRPTYTGRYPVRTPTVGFEPTSHF